MYSDYASSFAAMGLAFWLIFILSYLYVFIIGILCVSEWKLFEKAGEKGWKIFIPFYNEYTIFKIAYGKNEGWRFLLLLIPFANIVFAILFYIELSRAFGQSDAFAIGLILVSPIFICILGLAPEIQYIGGKKDRMCPPLQTTNMPTQGQMGPMMSDDNQ